MDPTPTKRLRLAIEPPPVAGGGRPTDEFALPSRLVDILPDGTEQFSHEGLDKSVGERLGRIWHERGDYSLLTADGIRRAQRKGANANANANEAEEDEHAQGDADADADARPSALEMRELQQALIEQLECARGELTTALDLLSVLAPVTDPPSIDPLSLPLPPQTLALVRSRAPPALPSHDVVPSAFPSTSTSTSTFASLPSALSLASLRSSASSFLAAAAALSRPTPSPWPTLLDLRSTTSFTLLPLGASRGATLTGAGDVRQAREVGLFYGCPEARESFRRAAVARIDDLKGAHGGRTLVLTLDSRGSTESVAWVADDPQGERVEQLLEQRSRAAFAEELFATLSSEARTDALLKARLVLGKRSDGDSIITEGSGWTLTLTMVTTPPPCSPTLLSRSLLALLRLLFLQEYALRRAPPATLLWTRPILQTLSVLLAHTTRLRALLTALEPLEISLNDLGLPVAIEGREAESIELGRAVLRILDGEKELGGLVVLRVGRSRVFHIAHSFQLPQPGMHPTQSLVLQSPGASMPVQIPSLSHLVLFLTEHTNQIRREMSSAKGGGGSE